MNLKENLERTIKRKSPLWVPERSDGSLVFIRSNVIAIRPIEGGKDIFGVNWVSTTIEEGSYPDGKPVVDIEDVENYDTPIVNWKHVVEDLKTQVENVKKNGSLAIVYHELTLFERVQLLLGFDEFMVASILNPVKFELLIEKVYNFSAHFVSAILESGADGVRFTDDWGMQDRLYISPEAWRIYFKKHFKSLYDMVKKENKYVFQHSCGRIMDIFEDIVELGIDVIDPCQPMANDLKFLKKTYGDKISFMGGLDTQSYLSFDTAEQVYEKVTKVLSFMSEGGGYIAAPSHTITIPEENRQAMKKAIVDFNNRK